MGEYYDDDDDGEPSREAWRLADDINSLLLTEPRDFWDLNRMCKEFREMFGLDLRRHLDVLYQTRKTFTTDLEEFLYDFEDLFDCDRMPPGARWKGVPTAETQGVTNAIIGSSKNKRKPRRRRGGRRIEGASRGGRGGAARGSMRGGIRGRGGRPNFGNRGGGFSGSDTHHHSNYPSPRSNAACRRRNEEWVYDNRRTYREEPKYEKKVEEVVWESPRPSPDYEASPPGFSRHSGYQSSRGMPRYDSPRKLSYTAPEEFHVVRMPKRSEPPPGFEDFMLPPPGYSTSVSSFTTSQKTIPPPALEDDKIDSNANVDIGPPPGFAHPILEAPVKVETTPPPIESPPPTLTPSMPAPPTASTSPSQASTAIEPTVTVTKSGLVVEKVESPRVQETIGWLKMALFKEGKVVPVPIGKIPDLLIERLGKDLKEKFQQRGLKEMVQFFADKTDELKMIRRQGEDFIQLSHDAFNEMKKVHGPSTSPQRSISSLSLVDSIIAKTENLLLGTPDGTLPLPELTKAMDMDEFELLKIVVPTGLVRINYETEPRRLELKRLRMKTAASSSFTSSSTAQTSHSALSATEAEKRLESESAPRPSLATLLEMGKNKPLGDDVCLFMINPQPPHREVLKIPLCRYPFAHEVFFTPERGTSKKNIQVHVEEIKDINHFYVCWDVEAGAAAKLEELGERLRKVYEIAKPLEYEYEPGDTLCAREFFRLPMVCGQIRCMNKYLRASVVKVTLDEQLILWLVDEGVEKKFPIVNVNPLDENFFGRCRSVAVRFCDTFEVVDDRLYGYQIENFIDLCKSGTCYMDAEFVDAEKKELVVSYMVARSRTPVPAGQRMIYQLRIPHDLIAKRSIRVMPPESPSPS